jgi:hypothetical protein
MQSGDILVVHTRGFIPWFIRWVTHSEYNHIAVAMDSCHIAEVSSSEPLTVRRNPYQPDDYVLMRRRGGLTLGEVHCIRSYITDNLETGYDWFAVVSIGLRFLAHIHAAVSDSTELACVTMASRAYANAGITLSKGLMAPGEFITCTELEVAS